MRFRFWIQLFLLFWATNFFLHFAWELLQISFYEGMTKAGHGAGVWTCTIATIGDTGIALAAYLGAAWSVRSLVWLRAWTLKPVLMYFLIGILITVVFEFLATEVLDRWAYGPNMPTLPLIGTGLAPFLQWIVVPALALGAVRLMYFGLLYIGRSANHDQVPPRSSVSRGSRDSVAKGERLI